MSRIQDWYGENTINWGAINSASNWGEVNATNFWGIIYPLTAGGTYITSDSTLYTADGTSATADMGDGTVVVDSGTPSGWVSTTAGVDNPSPVGVAITSEKHYRLESLDDNGTVYHIGTELPYNGFSNSISDILQYQGNTYNTASNMLFYTDQSSIKVGAFLADFEGTFFNSNDTHNTQFEQDYAYFNTPKYAAIKTNSLRGSNPTINENLIIKVEQYNGYLRITEILTT